MTRVLLIIDDYNEMIYLQTLLKKLGFDAEAIGNTRVFEETMLGFNPKVIVMTAYGKKINGLELSQKINRRNGIPGVVLLRSMGQVFTEDDLKKIDVDFLLDSPVNILILVKSICKLSGQNFEAIAEKLNKMMAKEKASVPEKKEPEKIEQNPVVDDNDQVKVVRGEVAEEENELKIVKSKKDEFDELTSEMTPNSVDQKMFNEVRETSINSEDREKKYDQYLSNIKDKPADSGGFSRDAIKSYNRQHRLAKPDKNSEALDNEKKEFVNTLFKISKSS